ncbi:sterol desaturase family protein [Streptomyces sp. NPDC056069]|uniref:sterol desaturase family protein n=1 Tax=Streptomyces sp. NPDC056069 TaxID=3345702 RepID=UPI0035DF8A03
MKSVHDVSNTARFRASGLSLGEAAGIFAQYPSPRVLVPAAVAAAAARAVAGGWSRRDATVAAALVVAEPFVEWMVHVHVLHQRPRRVLGRTVDSLAARKHRRHHRDPRNPALVFIPWQAALALTGGLAVANSLTLRNPRVALTGTAVSLLLLSTYEWTHFLIHSAYRPRSMVYRAIRRTHHLHHYRNENYWFGVITPLSDKIFSTDPPKGSVPPSSTVRTLGIDGPTPRG